jgi:glucosyl-dolichyl phosphate glucuronosyltransferase
MDRFGGASVYGFMRVGFERRPGAVPRSEMASARRDILDNYHSPQQRDPVAITRAYSIIVCTWNRAQLLGICLGAILAEMARTTEQGELLVVDNGSTDDTPSAVAALQERAPRHIPFSYLIERRPGLSIARNRGLKHATGNILIFVDDDAIVARGWLRSCLNAFERNPDAAAVGGEILPLSKRPIPDWLKPPITGVYSIISLGGDHIRPFPSPSLPVGANMAFRRAALTARQFSENLGRTGSNLISHEEGEIFIAIQQRGEKILYVPAMRVEHVIDPERMTPAWAIKRSYFEGVSKARMTLGWRRATYELALHCVKVFWLLATLPLTRSEFQKLLWQCRMRKSIGFFAERAAQLTQLIARRPR